MVASEYSSPSDLQPVKFVFSSKVERLLSGLS